MKRVAILVTHLLGSGHLSRALTLARAFKDAGLDPKVISGGMPAAHLDASGIDLVQLPPVQSDGARFTRLLDASGVPASAALFESRRHAIVAALEGFEPDVLITELFPFGRRVLSDEFEAALTAAQGLAEKPLVFASVRDILAPPSSARKAAETEARLQRFYDGVLVHSDPDVLPLEASWPVTPAVAAMLRYTGFIAAPNLPGSGNGSDGAGEILVTAGGGPVGRKLFETAIEAARLGQWRWRLLVGGVDAAAVCAKLNDAASGAPAFAEPARADYRFMLNRCAAAVGQCGYNTAIDWLQAGVAGVFVPFAEAGEVEQTLRAASLQERYGYGVIAEDELTAQKLSNAAAAAVARGRFAVDGLKLDGAEQTSRMVVEFLATHA
jgi:predicted glycosyltransferase